MACSEVTGVYRILPFYYVHVLDQNTNVTHLEVGPQTFVKQDHEKVLIGPERMLIIPPRHYCVIENPVVRGNDSEIVIDANGQVKLFHSDIEIRFSQDPFPLYPGEVLRKAVSPLQVVEPNRALRLRAVLDFVDDNGQEVHAGEEFLFEGPGTYFPRKEVHVDREIQANILKPNEAIRLRAKKKMIDRNGIEREAGEEWLIQMVGSYLPSAYEEVVSIVKAYVLTDKKALHIRALRTFVDIFKRKRLHGEEWLVYANDAETYIPDVYEENVIHNPGDLWMIRGPRDYIPAIEVEVVNRRKSIPLDVNEGIYVRNVKMGKIRSIIGSTYLLTENEELWEKELPTEVEQLLALDVRHFKNQSAVTAVLPPRDKSKVITYRVPHNACVQIYDYKSKNARIIFGPELVMLGPDEQFTILNLSVPDFVGDFCKTVAAKIRGAVAGISFDDFHKNSAKIIRTSVFGIDENKRINNRLVFTQNNLVLTSIDIQSVKPVDQRTQDALQKSVQLAIEITTNSQEAQAKHMASRIQQEAKGYLERQRITDEAEAEKERQELLVLQARSAAVELVGQSHAEAKSRAEAAIIEGDAAVEQATLRAEAGKIKSDTELDRLMQTRELELTHDKLTSELEIEKTKRITNIEIEEFKEHVAAIGSQTIQAMATSGPDNQVKLLQALGIKSTLITDGHSPINLFNTAVDLIGGSSNSHQGTFPMKTN
ncbi:unnamed protein product [Rotaria sp. Silwood2]|nr:unnamed protein product [Rotaria sp. Silwood2]